MEASASHPRALVVFHGGQMSARVAEAVRVAGTIHRYSVTLRDLETFETWLAECDSPRARALFIVTTVEDEKPDDGGAACLRFLRRKTHTNTTLSTLQYAVLGLGDSNLLADRYRSISWASARDCNQARDPNGPVVCLSGLNWRCCVSSSFSPSLCAP